MRMQIGSARTVRGTLWAVLVVAGIWSCGGGSATDVPDSGGSSGGSGGGSGNGASSSSSGSGSGSGGSSGVSTSGSSSGNASSGGSGSSGSSGVGTSSGGSGAGTDAGGSSGSASSSGGGSGSSSGGPPPSSTVSFSPDRVILTGVRALAAPTVTQTIKLHNGGQTTVQVTALALTGMDQALFQINGPPTLPAMLAPGADLPVTVQLMTAGALPPPPSNKDLGSNLLQAQLTATLGSGPVTASVYGLVLIKNIWEPTLGQILITLGYKLNVGAAQNNWNPNTSMNATNLPGIEANTDEVAASRFVKAGPGSVAMSVVARFSPVGVLPYGWYPITSSTTRNVVGTMSMVPDPQTSDKARMVNPPLAAGSATTFDPGSAPFGIWIYSDQKTQMYASGNAVNGDYDFTQDALNSPANVHRIKSYPLKDAAGMSIPQMYLVAVEEAGNGDYQDYVFLLGNVAAMP